MTHSIKRDFAHRTFGTIGSVTLSGEAQLSLDGKALPASSVEYLLTFALQSLQDAYAGAKDHTEAQANWEKKRDKLIEGTIGVRTGGGGVSETQKIARSILRAQLKSTPAWEAFKELSDTDQNDKLDALYEKNAEALRPVVEAEAKRRQKEREAKAKLATGLVLDL